MAGNFMIIIVLDYKLIDQVRVVELPEIEEVTKMDVNLLIII